MDAAFGSYRERGKSRLYSHLISDELINRDVSIGAVLCFGMQDAGKKRVHREVSAFDSVIESTVKRHVLAILAQGLEERRLFVPLASRFGEYALLLKSEQVADGNESLGSDACTTGGLHC
jgi:hypothetical protein